MVLGLPGWPNQLENRPLERLGNGGDSGGKTKGQPIQPRTDCFPQASETVENDCFCKN